MGSLKTSQKKQLRKPSSRLRSRTSEEKPSQPLEAFSKKKGVLSNKLESKSKFSELKFRRQFLLSARLCNELGNWKLEKFNDHFLYVHPSCEMVMIERSGTRVVLIGHFLDPHRPHLEQEQLVEELVDVESYEEITELLYPLVGRFVLLFIREGDFRIYHDPCGLKSVYYTFANNQLYAASQSSLLKLVIPLLEGTRYKNYFESPYVKLNKEHYLPAGLSVYENVDHLVPNHYLDLGDKKQVRYWPIKEPVSRTLDAAVIEISELLQKIMKAAHSKYKIVLPITGGFDSRLLLSACKDFKDEIQLYSLKYRNLNEKSPDLRIPLQMAAELNLNHRIIDCRKNTDPSFLKIYEANSSTPHTYDWGTIASGMYYGLEPGLKAVKGNCVEIGRCARYKDGKHPKSMGHDFLVDLEPNWQTLDFVSVRMKEWHEEIKSDENNKGYNELDLFYWEHRMGNWQAQSQLEWDIVQDALTPFNNRELIDLMLSVETKYRIRPNYILFKSLMKAMWPELLDYPINPKPFLQKAKDWIKYPLKRAGILKIIKKSIRG